ncbi:uncharacterized protein LOC124158881 [Ischnura elegans]|uniref:uncharacterized protein LOC124158881 n=1 Tax=Ischnura elegans TaxID=197161 RepID=UPI001ED8822A|nr:uncharacterized protein LOC124158881 [Ischnura elegans]
MSLRHVAIHIFASILLFQLVVLSRSEVDSTSQNSELRQCKRGPGINITSAVLLDNGSILDNRNSIVYPSGKWYRKNSTIIGCRCELRGMCLRKCCPKKHSYKYGRGKGCVWSEHDFELKVAIDGVNGKHTVMQVDELLIERSQCRGEDYLLQPDLYHDNAYSLLPDGRLSLPKSHVRELGPDSYCFESDSNDKARPYVCLENIYPDETFTTAGILIWRIPPLVFLACSILTGLSAGGSNDQLLTKINGFYLLINLVVARIVYASVTVFSTQVTDMDCLLLALIVQFFLLGSAFWLNVMCLDAFLMTRDSKSPCADIAATGYAKNFQIEKRNMVFRAIFAIMWPLLIVTSSGLTTTFSTSRNGINPKASLTQDWIRANSIAQGCLLGSDTILLSSNLILSMITLTAVVKAKKRYSTVQKDVRMSIAKERLFTCIGLILIISANRAVEGYVWMLPRAAERMDVLDYANGVQDVLISLMLSWNDIVNTINAFKLWIQRRSLPRESMEPFHAPAKFTLWLLGCKPPNGVSPALSNAPRIHA